MSTAIFSQRDRVFHWQGGLVAQNYHLELLHMTTSGIMVVKVHLLLHLAEEIPVGERGLTSLTDGLENALFSQI